eukprot:2000123-Amphidinium_carterae.2
MLEALALHSIRAYHCICCPCPVSAAVVACSTGVIRVGPLVGVVFALFSRAQLHVTFALCHTPADIKRIQDIACACAAYSSCEGHHRHTMGWTCIARAGRKSLASAAVDGNARCFKRSTNPKLSLPLCGIEYHSDLS